MRYREVMNKLKALGSPENVAGMARFGVVVKSAYGVSAPALWKLAREIGTDHGLAQQLWCSGNHDARGLATVIDDPRQVTEEQMERWARDFDSWAIVDGCCNYLFRMTPFASKKVLEWTKREEEYVKRAGFSMMAYLAVHDKDVTDARFLRYLAIIKREARDERNFVKKAVNWALRQIGKRNLRLHREAIQTATEIHALDSKAAKWIASDALRELKSEKVQQRLRRAASLRRPSRASSR